MGELLLKRKMVSSLVDKFSIKEDSTIQDLVTRINMNPILHDYLSVSIDDGEYIPKEEWRNRIVTNSSTVRVTVVPATGDSGKSGLAALAMIALTVFTYGASTSAWSLASVANIGGGTLVAAQVGVMFVGTLLINAIFPPSVPTTGDMGDSAGFMGMEGLKNRARPHGAIRNVFGRYKVAPDLAAETYVVTTGMFQTLYSLLDFGYGTVQVEDLRIGNTVANEYRGLEYKVLQNFTTEEQWLIDHPEDTDALEFYANDNVTESFKAEIRNAEYVERSFPSDETKETVIEISLPLGLNITRRSGGYRELSVSFNLFYSNDEDGQEDDWIPATGMGSMPTTSMPIAWSTNYTQGMYFTDLYTEVASTCTWRCTDATCTGYSYIEDGRDTFTVSSPATTTTFVFNTTITPPKPILKGQTFTFEGEVYTIDGITALADTYYSIPIVTIEDGQQITTYVQGLILNYTIVLDKPIPSNETHISNIADSSTYDLLGTIMQTSICVPNHGTELGDYFALTIPPVANFTLTRLEIKPFTLAISTKMPTVGKWKFRIIRTGYIYYDWLAWDPEHNESDRTELAAIRSITVRPPVSFKVPHTIMAIKVISTDQLSGMIDTITAMCHRILWVWNGVDTWTEEYTSNPAWVALNILRGGANPDPILDERIDFDSFYAWAVWCDLPSVQSPTTPKYQVDCNWDSMSTVYERLAQVMSAGRATFSFRDNKYSVIYDQFPTIPVQMFTPINSWDFKANRTFTKQPHALKVSFIDPDSEWQNIDRIVYADGYAEVDGGGDLAATYFENIDLPLCIRSDQAWRDGRYFLAQGILRPETFTITCDVENLVCERGDFVTIQHDVSKGGGTPSRIIGITTDVTGDIFELREPVVYITGEVNKLRVRYSNKTQVEFTVHTDTETLPQANSVKITITGTGAQVGDLVVYGQESMVTDEFLIKSISPAKDLSATLELVPIARAIETSDTGTIPDYTPKISQNVMVYPRPINPDLFVVNVILYYKNRMPVVDGTISWPLIGTNIKYEIWISNDASGHYEYKESVFETSNYVLWKEQSTLDSEYLRGNYLQLKIVPVNFLGLKPLLENCSELIIYRPYDTTKPSKPLFFAGNVTEQTMSFTWLPPVDEDIGGYILKYTPNIDNPTWDNSTAEGNMIPYSATTVDVNARIGAYMLKTIDTTGNISDGHALVKTTIPEISKMNLLEESIEDPLFTGTMNNVELVNGGIQLLETGLEGSYVNFGTYALTTLFDVGGIFRCYLTSQLEGKTIENYPISNWDTMTELESMSHVELGEWNAVVQVRTASTNGSMSDWTLLEDANTLTQTSDWGGWQNLTAGFYTGRYFQFRVVLTTISGYSTPHITKLKVTVDAPDRTEYGNDLIISELVNPDKLPVSTDPLDGHYVEFSKPFVNKPVIGITQDNAIDGQYHVIRNTDRFGFDIEFYTSDDSVGFSDAVVDEVQFDFTAKGYGEQESTFYNAVEAGEDDNIDQLPVAITTYLIL